jgi:DNA-binding response OmpR family regulator
MRLLLVEDDPRVARFVMKGLRERAYSVDMAENGEDALYKVFINDYDAVILDVMLPGRTGFEVCREVRANGSAVPIIMMTARDSLEDRVTGLDAGADDYLIKPFEVAELLARLRALLRRGHVVRPATLQIDDLIIDTRLQCASRAGRNITLTTKEYALLEYLGRNVGSVIGRAEISEHVWDETYDPLSNLIEVHINRLRRKIDDGFDQPLIHTRRGAGYMFGPLDANAAADGSDSPILRESVSPRCTVN